MRSANIGNILAFYKVNNNIPEITLQSDDYFNASSPHYVNASMNFVPFQLITTNTAYTFVVTNLNTGAEVVTLDMDIRNTSDARKIYTYLGNDNFSGTLSNCTAYFVKVKDGLGRVKFMSEKVYVRDNWGITITFTNSTDVGSVCYQNGYVQKLSFDPYEDFPIIDFEENVSVNLSGKEIRESARQVERRRIVVTGLIDSSLSALQSISMHGTVQLVERNPAETQTFDRVTFEIEDFDDTTKQGVFLIPISTVSVTGCGENTFSIVL